MDIKKFVRDVPDFPKKGVLFRDINPLLKSPEAIKFIVENLLESLDLKKIDYFAGVESRGFILASLLSAHYKKGFLPIRKAGKLPPPVMKVDYSLEYGQAALELGPGSGRLVIIDDVLATGGTLQAALELSTKAGYTVVDMAVLIDLRFLNDFKFQGRQIRSLIQY
jgi:adenine phosphoribosyltransferase